MTTSEAARVLQTSPATVIRLDGKKLHARRDASGARRFDEREVIELAASGEARTRATSSRSRIPSRVAIRAFEMFDAGAFGGDVVAELRIHPDDVDALHAKWSRMRRVRVLTLAEIDSLEREARSRGVDLNLHDAARSIRKLVRAASAQCSECARRAPTTCGECVDEIRRREIDLQAFERGSV